MTTDSFKHGSPSACGQTSAPAHGSSKNRCSRSVSAPSAVMAAARMQLQQCGGGVNTPPLNPLPSKYDLMRMRHNTHHLARMRCALVTTGAAMPSSPLRRLCSWPMRREHKHGAMSRVHVPPTVREVDDDGADCTPRSCGGGGSEGWTPRSALVAPRVDTSPAKRHRFHRSDARDLSAFLRRKSPPQPHKEEQERGSVACDLEGARQQTSCSLPAIPCFPRKRSSIPTLPPLCQVLHRPQNAGGNSHHGFQQKCGL